MSLYSEEEICEGCDHAVFHDCCKKFCHCKIKMEQLANDLNGTCPGHTKKEKQTKPESDV